MRPTGTATKSVFIPSTELTGQKYEGHLKVIMTNVWKEDMSETLLHIVTLKNIRAHQSTTD